MDDLFDDDGFLGVDDEGEELGIDVHTPLDDVPEPQIVQALGAPPSHVARAATAAAASPRARRVQVKPMGANLRARFPHVATMILTMHDGRQLVLVSA